MMRCAYPWIRGSASLLCRLAIPSMVPGAETLPAQQPEKAVWQLAFYAPLEETKGIKIFCDAVEQLPRTVLDRPGFEVGAPEGACGSSQGLRVPGLRMSCLRLSLAPITAAA